MDCPSFRPDRRRFLAWAAASAGVIAAHQKVPFAAMRTQTPSSEPARIRRLELISSAPLSRMKAYYHDTLGWPVVEQREDRLTIAAGGSLLTFLEGPRGQGQPFYHFAFNIPENKILDALRWQKARGPMLPIPPHMRDAKYPDEVVDFSHWNAHSLFFYDPAGNVVEYIARHDLKNAAPGAFGVGDILCISEIGLIVDDVEATAAKVREVVGLPQYRGGNDQFIAAGDEHGLLLIMKRGRFLNFDPTSDAKAARVYPTAIGVRGRARGLFVVPAFPYELAIEK